MASICKDSRRPPIVKDVCLQMQAADEVVYEQLLPERHNMRSPLYPSTKEEYSAIDMPSSLPSQAKAGPSVSPVQAWKRSILDNVFSFRLLCFLLVAIFWISISFEVTSPPNDAVVDPVLRHCLSLPPLPPSSYTHRRQSLSASLSPGDIFLTEPSATSSYLFGVNSTTWSLSERVFLIGVTSRQGDEEEQAGKVVMLTPKFEADRARLIDLAGVKNTHHEVVYVEWEESANPFDVLVQHFSRNTSSAQQTRRTFHLDPYARSFILAGITTASKHLDWDVVVAEPSLVGRERKSADEVELLRCANQLTLEAIKETREEMYIGIKESTTRMMLQKNLEKLGIEEGDGLVLFGENAALPHGSGTDKTLGRNDLALIDCGGSFRGYISDVTRTFALRGSQLSDTQIRVWKTVREAQRAAFESVKVGISGKVVDDAARDVVRRKGEREVERTGFTHRLGHGIGLEGHEGPYLVGSNLAPLHPGNVFSDEPGIYIPGELGVRLEDVFVVDEKSGKGIMFTSPAENPWLL